MTKTQLINRIARTHKISKKDAGSMVNMFCEGISNSLKRGQRVSIAGFGSFSVKKTGGFTARNPRTGSSKKVPASKMINFTPAASWNPAKKRSSSTRKSYSQKRSYR